MATLRIGRQGPLERVTLRGDRATVPRERICTFAFCYKFRSTSYPGCAMRTMGTPGALTFLAIVAAMVAAALVVLAG